MKGRREGEEGGPWAGVKSSGGEKICASDRCSLSSPASSPANAVAQQPAPTPPATSGLERSAKEEAWEPGEELRADLAELAPGRPEERDAKAAKLC
eukprot:3093626-Rhodomonas_salina.1